MTTEQVVEPNILPTATGLEAWRDDYIPGTEIISAGAEQDLIPTPTQSPNDPLNWGKYRKLWHMILVCSITGLTAAITNNAGSAQDGYNEEYGITWGAFTTATGVLFIGIGYFTWIMSPASFLYGRRIGYLVCLLIGLLGNVWFALTTTTGSAIWSQLFVGASESVAEAQVQLSLTDIYFQHDIGSAMAWYILATSIGTFLGPLIGGYVADRLGANWIGWLGVITSGFFLVVTYFGLEETMFDRNLYNTVYLEQHAVPISSGKLGSKELEANENSNASDNAAIDSRTNSSSGVVSKRSEDLAAADPERALDVTVRQDRPKSYWQRIAVITLADNIKGTGFKQFIKRFLLTVRVFLFPPVLYSGLQWGAQDAWLSFYIDTEEDLWTEDPFNYGDVACGLMNVPSLIGAIIGCLYAGLLSDWFVRWMAKRNNNVMEAESRLWLMLPVAIINPLGLILFGAGTQYAWSWPGPYVGLGLIGFGWGCAGDISLSYLCDAYPGMVLEGMVGVSIINNTIGMIFSFVTEDWIYAIGPLNTYISIGVLCFVFVMTTAPMIYYGKRCRVWTKGMYLRFIEERDGL